MVGTLVRSNMLVNVVNELGHFVHSIEAFERFVNFEVVIVKAHAWNPAVVVVEDARQYLLLVTKVLGKWSPQESHALNLFKRSFVSVMQS